MRNKLRVFLALGLLLWMGGIASAQTVINQQNWDSASYAAGTYPSGWVSSNTSYWLVTGGVGAPYSSPNALCFYDPSGGVTDFYSVGYNTADSNAGNISATYDYRFEQLNGSTAAPICSIFYFRSNTIAGESQSSGYRIQICTGQGGSFDGIKLDRLSSGTTTVNTGAAGSAAPALNTFGSSFIKQVYYKVHLTAVGGRIQLEIQRPQYLANGTTANGIGDNKWLTNTGAWSATEQNAIDYTDGSPVSGSGYYGFAVYAAGTYSPAFEIDNFLLTTASNAATAGTITPPSPANGQAGVTTSNFTFRANGPLTGTVTLSTEAQAERSAAPISPAATC